MTDPKTEHVELSFEEALRQLETIVNDLEQGELPLEQSLAQFERAVKLARVSQQKLHQAEQKVQRLMQQQGSEQLVDFEAPDESN